jgi:TolB-like protein
MGRQTTGGLVRVLVPLLALPLACVTTTTLENTGPPASVVDRYPLGSVSPLGFAADLDVRARPSSSASNQGLFGSEVFEYPMRSILDSAFGDYFVPSLFSAPFEGNVASAFRVEARLESALIQLDEDSAGANVKLEVSIFGPEFNEELYRVTVLGEANSAFDGTSTPDAIWEATFAAAREALRGAATEPRLAGYLAEEPLHEFQSDGPKWDIGVLRFETASQKQGLDGSTASIIWSKVLDDLAQRSNRITVLELEQTKILMREKQYQEAGFAREIVAKLGASIGARFMIFGTVAYQANQYTITFRMVDVETREVLASPVEHSPKASPRQLERVTRKAVNTLLERLDGMH